MARLLTVDKAKSEKQRLQSYIDLVKNYQTDTIERIIIVCSYEQHCKCHRKFIESGY